MAAGRVSRVRGARDPRRRRGPGEWARLRGRLAWVALAAALGCAVVAGVTAGAPDPQPVRVQPDGTTPVPATHFFQPPWVLYAAVQDPRRVPAADLLGCAPTGGLRSAVQPTDLTQFGAHVVDGRSISAVLLLGRSGDDAALRCAGAGPYAPLWLFPSTAAPPFAPTAFVLLALLALAVAALAHPRTADLPQLVAERLRRERE